MELKQRSLLVYVLLASVWALVAAWQAEEHFRVREVAKADLNQSSKVIANTVSACIRGMQFRRGVPQDRLEPVLTELIGGRTNELVHSSELISIVLLNAANEPVASAGRQVDLTQQDLQQHGERWGQHTVTFVNPVDLGTVVFPPFHDGTNSIHDGPGRPAQPPEPPPGEPRPPPTGGAAVDSTNHPPPTNLPASPDRGGRRGRPPWLRNMDEQEYQSLLEKRTLHGLVIALSTDSFQAASARDLWLRLFIVGLATLAALGSGLAWRSLVTTSDLQIRLVRASELNTHLKEMNVAAAGLAHETRNPLNIIRGLAQMISKQPEAAPEIRQKSSEIVNEADKVAAQLNEFINYSRPREVRRTALVLTSVINEVVRTLNYDLEEKKIRLQVKSEVLNVQADEQLLRQSLFNLLLNAIQAVPPGGEIQVLAGRDTAAEAWLEVRDNGPGVPPERRAEIFKPYFTTQKTGTGLGLAVVQQIVLAHGWEIQCLGNEPSGAVFRMTHLKVAGQ
jgi:signal transduction histidine kinase